MDMLTCTIDECKEEFDFDMQNVVTSLPKPDAGKQLVSSLMNED